MDLQKNYPNLELQVIIGNTGEIVQFVRLFQVDIGLIEGQTNEKDLSVHPFLQDELFIISSNDDELANKNDVTMIDLSESILDNKRMGFRYGRIYEPCHSLQWFKSEVSSDHQQ